MEYLSYSWFFKRRLLLGMHKYSSIIISMKLKELFHFVS